MKNENGYPQGTKVIVYKIDSEGTEYRGEIVGITSRHPGCIFYIVRLFDKVPGNDYECFSIISSCLKKSLDN